MQAFCVHSCIFDVCNCRRESSIKKLLGHHVRLSYEEQYLTKELFVLDKLQVPTQWIHEAKVMNSSISRAFFSYFSSMKVLSKGLCFGGFFADLLG